MCVPAGARAPPRSRPGAGLCPGRTLGGGAQCDGGGATHARRSRPGPGGGRARPGPHPRSARSKVGEPRRPAATRELSPPGEGASGPSERVPPARRPDGRNRLSVGRGFLPGFLSPLGAGSFRFPGREVCAPRETVAFPRERTAFLWAAAHLVIYLGDCFAVPLPGVPESERTGKLDVTLWPL